MSPSISFGRDSPAPVVAAPCFQGLDPPREKHFKRPFGLGGGGGLGGDAASLVANRAMLFSVGSTDGHFHGRLPALPAKHLRGDPLPAPHLGGGNCWHHGVILHGHPLLLLRE